MMWTRWAIRLTAPGENFITGLSGAEGAFIDPLTGDFLFSTFGGNRVILVTGFAVSEPGTVIGISGRVGDAGLGSATAS